MSKDKDKNHLFKINQPKKAKNEPKLYTMKGEEDFIDYENNPRCRSENNHTLAKATNKQDGSYRYYIKISHDGKPYNPTSIYGMPKSNHLLDTIGKAKAVFREVNPRAFNMYLSFLRTKNPAWITNVEREII